LDPGAGRGLPDCLDRGDLRVADAVDRRDARARRCAVQMHRAGAAQRHAAAEFRAGHPQHVAQHPQQRGIAVDIHRVSGAVDADGEGHALTPYELRSMRATRWLATGVVRAFAGASLTSMNSNASSPPACPNVNGSPIAITVATAMASTIGANHFMAHLLPW